MARNQQLHKNTRRAITQAYPIGSISSGTMRSEDLIPRFLTELERQLKHGPSQSRETRRRHSILANNRRTSPDYWESDDVAHDLDALFDALGEYAGPYFYFGSHPGDGSDYGFWLSEDWDSEFQEDMAELDRSDNGGSIKVNDLAEVPDWFRGEVAVVKDHGNITLYTKTSRKLTEIWSMV